MDLRRASGFTLIELMVTVAILAVLIAVSIPLYDRYQAKARQSEAKLALSAVYSSEKAFYSEYSAYLSAFDGLDYVAEGARRYYTVGWGSAQTGTVTGYTGVYTTPAWSSVNTFSTVDCPPSVAYPLLPPGLGTDPQTFTAGAAGEIRIGQGCDIWTIDDLKNLQNTVIKL